MSETFNITYYIVVTTGIVSVLVWLFVSDVSFSLHSIVSCIASIVTSFVIIVGVGDLLMSYKRRELFDYMHTQYNLPIGPMVRLCEKYKLAVFPVAYFKEVLRGNGDIHETYNIIEDELDKGSLYNIKDAKLRAVGLHLNCM